MYSLCNAGFVSPTWVELSAIAFEFDLRRSHFALIVLDARLVTNRVFYDKTPYSPHQRAKTRFLKLDPIFLIAFLFPVNFTFGVNFTGLFVKSFFGMIPFLKNFF